MARLLEAESGQKREALDIAASSGHLDVANFLLDAGATVDRDNYALICNQAA